MAGTTRTTTERAFGELSLLFVDEHPDDYAPDEVSEIGRGVMRDMGVRETGRTVAIAAAAAGTILPLVAYVAGLWFAWAHRADTYPVVDVLDLLRAGGVWAASSAVLALGSLGALLWLAGARAPWVGPRREHRALKDAVPGEAVQGA
jgi:hypothetical protein